MDLIFGGHEFQEDFLYFLVLEDGTDRLSRNVGTELPPYAAQYPRRAQVPFIATEA
jgi:hypothetical protein